VRAGRATIWVLTIGSSGSRRVIVRLRASRLRRFGDQA
jgi:hypothetical protein